MEICFRESKEIILYGMKKYCASEGLVNLKEAMYDYWMKSMGIYDGLLRIYKNLRKRTRTNAKPTPTHITYAKPKQMHKTYAKPTQMHMRFSSIIVTTLCTRLAFHSFSPQSPASALHPENEKDTCLVDDQRRTRNRGGRYRSYGINFQRPSAGAQFLIGPLTFSFTTIGRIG